MQEQVLPCNTRCGELPYSLKRVRRFDRKWVCRFLLRLNPSFLILIASSSHPRRCYSCMHQQHSSDEYLGFELNLRKEGVRAITIPLILTTQDSIHSS
ncbi:hypothetical protein QL285_033130 [Trifolium repens]|nr:hypothetical protein QL285_033130 [Trifolium repens]